MSTTAVATVNPFAASVRAPVPGPVAVAQSDQSRSIAEVQAAMMIARSAPRDPIAAMDRILNACSRTTLAESAVYTYARGGSDISGPSIRLAETMAQQWGNISFGIRELEQRDGESQVLAYAWDMETNTRREIAFSVKHIRYTKAGAKKLEDPRDIYELVANQGSRRLRACILAVIPGDVTEAAVKQCELTLHTSADTSPETLAKMVAAFAQFGVTKEHIEARIQRRLDAIQPAQVVSLKKVYASLKDGMSAPSDWFDVPAAAAEPAPAAIADINAKLSGKKRPAPTGETSPPAGPSYAEVRQAIERANDADALDAAVSLIASVGGHLQGELRELADAQRKAQAA